MEALSSTFGQRLRGVTAGWTRGDILGLIGVLLWAVDWAGVQPSDIAGWLSALPEQIASILDEAEKNGPPTPPRPER
ncbi:hypothetical protein [Nocardioides sp. Arc9.136]|uniref:hypothetical protein n=1 Tax=Nocardioides sp. Arc9.136 TaxID=2996826 RepID=UPI0026671581|nr:hypothetical protein [Nocardioides sp. Arc9.136]WKN47165.1 hypothetical protein OSR43_14065 [Nocardioides sp. Arc9.136]